jgi:hypothetical protein
MTGAGEIEGQLSHFRLGLMLVWCAAALGLMPTVANNVQFTSA